MALVTAPIVFLGEIPFSYLLLDSVLIPIAFEDFLIMTGLKTAPSRKIDEVVLVTEVSKPPITPAIATGLSQQVITVILSFNSYFSQEY